MTNNYKSEPARAQAVFKFALFSWMATMFTYGCFLAVCAAFDIVNIYLVLLLIAAQFISWLVCLFAMTLVYDMMSNPPTPKEKQPEPQELKERIVPVFKYRR